MANLQLQQSCRRRGDIARELALLRTACKPAGNFALMQIYWSLRFISNSPTWLSTAINMSDALTTAQVPGRRLARAAADTFPVASSKSAPPRFALYSALK
jgi:hypothetical protein